jgi:hypothetical protein
MEKKGTILIVVLSISCSSLSAGIMPDTTVARPLKDVNINLLGASSLISLNFERMFLINSKLLLACQIGVGYNEEFQLFDKSPAEKYVIVPHHVTACIGKKKQFIEFGIFGAVVSGKTEYHYLLGPVAGYRIHPLRSDRINFRIYGNIPVIGFETEIIAVWFGLSLGIAF